MLTASDAWHKLYRPSQKPRDPPPATFPAAPLVVLRRDSSPPQSAVRAAIDPATPAETAATTTPTVPSTAANSDAVPSTTSADIHPSDLAPYTPAWRLA